MKKAVLAVLVALVVAGAALPAAAGTREIGIAVPLSSTFLFSSYTVGLELYAQWLGASLLLETALGTNTRLSGFYLRNTLLTPNPVFLAFGLATHLFPSFGSSVLTGGVGLRFGDALVTRLTASVAVSISVYGLYWFPQLRFQIGLDP